MSYNCAYVGSRWLTLFFFREHRFAVRCRVVTLRQLLWILFTLLFILSMCLLHKFLYIFFINIGCATLASGGVIVRTPKCGVSVRIAIYRKTVRDRKI